MSEQKLVLHSMSEVVAAVPHLLGVHPRDSLVVVPDVIGDAPVARVDLPGGRAQSMTVAAELGHVYAGLGVGVVLLAYTGRQDLAREACQSIRGHLQPAVAVIGTVAVDGLDWVRPDGPQHGLVSQGDQDLMTAEFLLMNRPPPFETLALLRQAYAPDLPLPKQLMGPAAERANAAARGVGLENAEREWITATLDRAAAGHTVLSDRDAARLISDVQHQHLRDHAWASMQRGTAPQHAEMWRDLLTRCPDGDTPPTSPVSSVSSGSPVAPVASLAAFAHWLDGDAVKARVALDRIPDRTQYQMARLIDVALEVGMNPREWTLPAALGELDGQQPEQPEQPEQYGRPRSPGLGHAIADPPASAPRRGREGPSR